MPERPVHQHPAYSPRRADASGPRPDIESSICLTLRVLSPDGIQARASFEYLLRDIPGLRVMAVSHRRGTATLVLQARREELDALLHGVMASVPGAEFGPIRPAGLAAVH